MISSILSILRSKRLPLHDEKTLQEAIYKELLSNFPEFIINREYRFDDRNVIDFLINEECGIEVKIKASKRAIYKQVERYCQFEKIKSLFLITNTSMGFPEQINGKNCYILNLGKAWL